MICEGFHKSLHPLSRKHLISIITELLKVWFTEPEDGEVRIFYELDPGKGIKNYHPVEFGNFVKCMSKELPEKYIAYSKIESECVFFLGDLVKREIHEDEEIGKELEILREKLENIVGKWHVIIPINNLALENLEKIKIGNTLLIPFKDIEAKIKLHISKIVDSGISTSSAKESFRIETENYIIPKFKNKICACIKITAANDMLYQEALREAEDIINLLRIYVPLSANDKYVKIGINEDWVSPLSLICLRQDRQGINFPSKAFKFKLNYVITKEILILLEKEYHLKDLEKILCKEPTSRSKYENQILTAMRWLGMGIHDDINSDKFLKFAIALECLILIKNDRSKSEALAERCAYLLGNSQEERFDIFREIKDLYDIRGNIVHNGNDHIQEYKLDRFQEIVRSCLFKILDLQMNLEIKETKDLIKWVDYQKFK